MRLLVACEYSGRVREAFRARGHDAWSADLLDSEDGSPHHIKGDVLRVLRRSWDAVIAHPPCTRLTLAGVRWLHERNLWADLDEGAAFFNAFKGSAPLVAIKNPQPHGYATAKIGAYVQKVQPWWFGDEAFKGICLWLEGFAPLTPTKLLTPPKPKTLEHARWSAVHRASPGPNRWKERSRTYPGFANAMAEQWG